MKIQALMISASLPPFAESSTIQLVERVRRFPSNGIEAIFVGPDIRGVEVDLLQRLPEGSPIFRAPAPTYDRTRECLSKFPGGQFLTWVYSNLMYYISAPDVRAGWEKQVIRLCVQLCSERKPDIIITSGGSHSAHIAGRHLAQRLSVPWVADMGDPWSVTGAGSGPIFFKTWRNRQLERRTIPFASGLVFTTETTLAAYRAWLGNSLPNAIVLPAYGYDPSEFNVAPVEPDYVGEEIILSYIGTAHRGNRNLIPIIKTLGMLQRDRGLRHRFTLTVVGTYSHFFEREARRQGLSSVHFLGRVPYKESIKWMLRSHVLVIVGNASPLMIPAKVYPHLGSGRPILYIGQLPADVDPTASLLRKFPGVLFAQDNVQSLATAMHQIDRDYSNLREAALKRLDKAELKEYESTAISDRFAKFVLEIASHGSEC